MEINELVELYIQQSFPEGYITKLFHGVYTGSLDDGAQVVVSSVPMRENTVEVTVSLGEEKIIEKYYFKDNGFYLLETNIKR